MESKKICTYKLLNIYIVILDIHRIGIPIPLSQSVPWVPIPYVLRNDEF